MRPFQLTLKQLIRIGNESLRSNAKWPSSQITRSQYHKHMCSSIIVNGRAPKKWEFKAKPLLPTAITEALSLRVCVPISAHRG